MHLIIFKFLFQAMSVTGGPILSIRYENKAPCNATEITITGCLGPKDCLYPKPDNCDQFIHCEVNPDDTTGRPTVKDCPSGLEWNDKEKMCDWPSNANCHKPMQVTADLAKMLLPPPGGAFDPGFDCVAEELFVGCYEPTCLFANGDDKQTFVECRNGIPYVLKCPEGKVYNDDIKACE